MFFCLFCSFLHSIEKLTPRLTAIFSALGPTSPLLLLLVKTRHAFGMGVCSACWARILKGRSTSYIRPLSPEDALKLNVKLVCHWYTETRSPGIYAYGACKDYKPYGMESFLGLVDATHSDGDNFCISAGQRQHFAQLVLGTSEAHQAQVASAARSASRVASATDTPAYPPRRSTKSDRTARASKRGLG